MTPLTQGAIERLLRKEQVDPPPVLQILKIQPTRGPSGDWYELILWDGVLPHTDVILGQQLNYKVENKEIDQYAVVTLNSYNWFPFLLRNALFVLDLSVVERASNVGRLLQGRPEQASGDVISIAQLKPPMKRWTIKALVMEVEVKTSQKGEPYLSVKLNDSTETIRAVAFKDVAAKFSELLEKNKVYLISNGFVKDIPPEYYCEGCRYEVIFNDETKIRPFHQAEPNLGAP